MTCPVSLPERDMPAVQHVTGRDNVNPGGECSVGPVDPFNMIVKYRFVVLLMLFVDCDIGYPYLVTWNAFQSKIRRTGCFFAQTLNKRSRKRKKYVH